MNLMRFFNLHLAKVLTERELRIVMFRQKDAFDFGENAKTFTEISELENVCRERARQILHKAIRKINKQLYSLDTKIKTEIIVIKEDNISSTPISILGDMSVRTTNCLKMSGIDTVEQLLDLESHTLLKIPNFGRKSLRELQLNIERYVKTKV